MSLKQLLKLGSAWRQRRRNRRLGISAPRATRRRAGDSASLARRARKTSRRKVPLSGCELLGVARSGLHDLGADFSARGVNGGDGITRLVVAHAPRARSLFPIGA